VIELKVQHKSREGTVSEGLAPTIEHADRCGAAEAHLVVFDRRAGASWEEKVFCEIHVQGGRTVTVWGM